MKHTWNDTRRGMPGVVAEAVVQPPFNSSHLCLSTRLCDKQWPMESTIAAVPDQ